MAYVLRVQSGPWLSRIWQSFVHMPMVWGFVRTKVGQAIESHDPSARGKGLGLSRRIDDACDVSEVSSSRVTRLRPLLHEVWHSLGARTLWHTSSSSPLQSPRRCSEACGIDRPAPLDDLHLAKSGRDDTRVAYQGGATKPPATSDFQSSGSVQVCETSLFLFVEGLGQGRRRDSIRPDDRCTDWSLESYGCSRSCGA